MIDIGFSFYSDQVPSALSKPLIPSRIVFEYISKNIEFLFSLYSYDYSKDNLSSDELKP